MSTSWQTKESLNKNLTKRVILHLDYDSFFASVEQQANPLLRGKPFGVGGSSLTKGIVCAASKEAKKYGIKTAMPVFKAKELCPQFFNIKGDFTKYQYIHKKSIEIFGTYTDFVEPFSIDECFMDVTDTLKFFDSVENLTKSIKKDVAQAFGKYVTCSIGVGPNKLTAKLVSDFNKPNGIYIVTPKNINQTLHSAKLTDFCGIGPRIEKRLNKLNIYTVKDLQQAPPEWLYLEFGNVGANFLKNLSFGVDNSSVLHIQQTRRPKSIGHQHTLGKNTKDPIVIRNNLRRIAEMVSRRLRKKEMLGKTIGVYVRDSSFGGAHERTTINHYTESGQEIYSVALNLLKKLNWNKETRLVSVNISNLIYKKSLPLYLIPQDQKLEKIIKASDLVNNKFGEFTMVTGDTINAETTKGKISSFLRH